MIYSIDVIISTVIFIKMSMQHDCIFCKIANSLAEADIKLKNDEVVVFKDISPAARHHYLVIPRTHIIDASYLDAKDSDLVSKLLHYALEVLDNERVDMETARFGFHWPPFRSVKHLHLHAIAPCSDLSFLNRIIFRPNSYWFVSPTYVINRLSAMGGK